MVRGSSPNLGEVLVDVELATDDGCGGGNGGRRDLMLALLKGARLGDEDDDDDEEDEDESEDEEEEEDGESSSDASWAISPFSRADVSKASAALPSSSIATSVASESLLPAAAPSCSNSGSTATGLRTKTSIVSPIVIVDCDTPRRTDTSHRGSDCDPVCANRSAIDEGAIVPTANSMVSLAQKIIKCFFLFFSRLIKFNR